MSDELDDAVTSYALANHRYRVALAETETAWAAWESARDDAKVLRQKFETAREHLLRTAE